MSMEPVSAFAAISEDVSTDLTCHGTQHGILVQTGGAVSRLTRTDGKFSRHISGTVGLELGPALL